MNSLENSLAPILLPLSSLRLFQLPRATRLALEMLDRLEGGALAVELPHGVRVRTGHGPLVAHLRVRDHAVFDDVLARNRWEERVAAGERPADVLADLAITARDNARTPMQRSAAPGAGFTTGTPWLKPNPNHARINVAAQEADPDSVLNYYRRLIGLRKAERVLVEGAYHPLMASHRQIYAYCRGEGAGRLVVIVNLGKRPARYCHAGLMLAHEGLLLANLPVAPHAPRDSLQLRPYEARVYRVGAR